MTVFPIGRLERDKYTNKVNRYVAMKNLTHPHLALLFHCIIQDEDEVPATNPELFVPIGKIEELIVELKSRGHVFQLPDDTSHSLPTATISFDDGYFNNSLFLSLAEKYKIPFILFVASYNILHQTPFIWDLWPVINNKYQFNNVLENYASFYEKLSPSEKETLWNSHYRPFTCDELKNFSRSKYVSLGLHTHTHQPLFKMPIDSLKQEIAENENFLRQFEGPRLRDFSLPCGEYDRQSMAYLESKFDRIYTIKGGSYHPSRKIINRISLINPKIGGSLMSQIDRSFSLKNRLKRALPFMRNARRLKKLLTSLR